VDPKDALTPREIVAELDRYVVGQQDAKRMVAIALRNRWRRRRLGPDMQDEVLPKNIILIGPTGVGKTEIARRVARLADAPFVKVEASKFTEVGYVGRDVETIIRDLVDAAVKMLREQEKEKVDLQASLAAEERVLDALLPSPTPHSFEDEGRSLGTVSQATRDRFREKLRSGELDQKEVDIEISATPLGVEIMAPPGMEEMTSQLQGLFQSLGSQRTRRRKLRVKDAFKVLRDEEAGKRINEEDLKLRALELVEQNGIVFLDELDKVAKRGEYGGPDVSREGVQRDLLPLVEGCTVSTKYGTVRTDHILFIASGAFHLAKPSDLIPELQGRLPIRVELDALTTEDFVRILTEPDASLTDQYKALLATEQVPLEFTPEGIRRIAELAYQINESTENIGARRLHTVLERLLEGLSFEAPEQAGRSVTIDAAYVDRQLAELAANEDLSRYIL